MSTTGEKKASRSEVAATPQAMVTLLDALTTAVVVADERGAIRFCNAPGQAWLGEATNVLDALSRIKGLGHDAEWRTVWRDVVVLNQARTVHGVDRPHEGTGHPSNYLTVRIRPLGRDWNGSGEATFVVTIQPHDVEEPSSDMAERLSRLGGLTAKIAHELNNPLDGILRYVNLALRLLGDRDDPRLKNYLCESRTGLMRMVRIIAELLQYSRRTDGAFDESDVNEIVEQALRNIAPAAEQQGIVVAADFQTPNMPVARGSRLYQICCNLLKNAVEAMPNGGRLTVTCGVVEGEVVIRVADTGVGLPVDTARLFEPFYTTKTEGKGTGLGLAICKEFVEEMKGSIAARPAEGGGAEFSVHLPLSAFHPPTAFHHRGGRPPARKPKRKG